MNSLISRNSVIIASFCILASFLVSCDGTPRDYREALYGSANYSTLAYDLGKPDTIILLHRDLTEISGLTHHPSGNLLAVQDEKGVVYILNPRDGSIIKRIRFAPNGDYEGIQYRNDTVYVLKSSGKIFRFPYSEDPEVSSVEINTPLNRVNDAEGLCYNGDFEELLIACKGHPSPKGKEDLPGRSVFTFSIAKEKLNKKPKYSLLKEEVVSWATANMVNLKSPKATQIRPSGIAQHPISKDYYIVSSIGKLLIVISEDGSLSGAYPLNPARFRQPEGICFDDNGKMYISNEGKGRRGNLIVFSPKVQDLNEETAD